MQSFPRTIFPSTYYRCGVSSFSWKTMAPVKLLFIRNTIQRVFQGTYICRVLLSNSYCFSKIRSRPGSICIGSWYTQSPIGIYLFRTQSHLYLFVSIIYNTRIYSVTEWNGIRFKKKKKPLKTVEIITRLRFTENYIILFILFFL